MERTQYLIGLFNLKTHDFLPSQRILKIVFLWLFLVFHSFLPLLTSVRWIVEVTSESMLHVSQLSFHTIHLCHFEHHSAGMDVHSFGGIWQSSSSPIFCFNCGICFILIIFFLFLRFLITLSFLWISYIFESC